MIATPRSGSKIASACFNNAPRRMRSHVALRIPRGLPISVGMDAKSPKSPRHRWGATILACGKCLKRSGAGKSIRRALKNELRRHAAGQQAPSSPAKPRILRTTCLGLCPKRAVVLSSAASISRDEVVILSATGSVEAAVARLLPAGPTPVDYSDSGYSAA